MLGIAGGRQRGKLQNLRFKVKKAQHWTDHPATSACPIELAETPSPSLTAVALREGMWRLGEEMELGEGSAQPPLMETCLGVQRMGVYIGEPQGPSVL